MKKFEQYERRGLPGGPNEITSYMTGAISTQGYKSNSPDKYNDFNLIPSGDITMNNVDFPVFGMDNLGNMAAMMPGANYKFPGSMVFEMPMAQRGLEKYQVKGETVDGIPMLDPNRPISSQTDAYTPPSEADRIAIQDAKNYVNPTYFNNYVKAATTFTPEKFEYAPNRVGIARSLAKDKFYDEPIHVDTDIKDPTYRDFFYDSEVFTENWLNSPQYKKMLKESTDSETLGDYYRPEYDYDYLNEGRRWNFEKSKGNQFIKNNLNMTPWEVYTSPSAGVAAYSLSHRPQTIYRKPADIPILSPLWTPETALRTVAIHELSHATDRPLFNEDMIDRDNHYHRKRLIPFKDVELIEDLALPKDEVERNFIYNMLDPTPMLSDQFNYEYFSEPTEARARLSEVRALLAREGKDVFNYDITMDDLDKARRKYVPMQGLPANSNYKSLMQLISTFGMEGTLQLLNTISQAEPQENIYDLPMAQKGLEKYQTKGELTDYGFGGFGEVLPNEVLTMGNAPAFFNNQAVYYRDDSVPVETEQRYNDMIREKVYAGTHGYNPATKQLVVLDEAADVNSLDQLYSSLDRDEMPGSVSSGIASKDREAYMDTLPADQREALEDEYKDMRKGFVMRSNEAAFKNPIMYAPGLAYTMGVLGPAYGPAISSTAGTYASAPLTIGSYVNPYITAGNLLNAGFAADFAVNRAPKIPGLIQEGNYGEAALEGGFGALDLAGAGVFSNARRIGSKASNLSRSATDGINAMGKNSKVEPMPENIKKMFDDPNFQKMLVMDRYAAYEPTNIDEITQLDELYAKALDDLYIRMHSPATKFKLKNQGFSDQQVDDWITRRKNHLQDKIDNIKLLAFDKNKARPSAKKTLAFAANDANLTGLRNTYLQDRPGDIIPFFKQRKKDDALSLARHELSHLEDYAGGLLTLPEVSLINSTVGKTPFEKITSSRFFPNTLFPKAAPYATARGDYFREPTEVRARLHALDQIIQNNPGLTLNSFDRSNPLNLWNRFKHPAGRLQFDQLNYIMPKNKIYELDRFISEAEPQQDVNEMPMAQKGGELEQRAIAMGESPEYATAVQRMIDNGATIQELASRRIGTVSGLSQLFPDAEMGSVPQRSSSSSSSSSGSGANSEDNSRYYNRALKFFSEGKTIDDLVNMRYGTRDGLIRMFPNAPISSSATYSPSPENKPSPMPQQTPAQVSSGPTEIPAQPAMITPEPIIQRKDVDAGLAADAQMAREQMRSGSLSTQPNITYESYLPETIIYGEKEEPLGYNSISSPSFSGQFDFSSDLNKFLPIPAASTEPFFTVPEGTFRGPSSIEEIRQRSEEQQERGKAILQNEYTSSGVDKYTNISFDEYPSYLTENMEGYDQVINEAEKKMSKPLVSLGPYADVITKTEINRRLAYDIPRYGEFMNNPRVVNRTGNLRQNDANIFFADIAKPNSVIIDIGAGLGNSNPSEAGVSTYELFKNPKIQQNNIKVIASDIAPEAEKFITREDNPYADMDAYSIPINEQDWSDINNYMTPVGDILEEKGVSDVEDVYLRATNGIDILMDEDVTEKHFEHLANTLTDKNITYVFNNVILYKPKGGKQFAKIGNVSNTGMDHKNPSWIGKDFDPTRRSHYLLNDDLFGGDYVPSRRFGGRIDDDGKIKYVAETDQGGYRVGVDVDRGDRQRSKSFSLEPSGDTSYSRSVTTPKRSRSKSIDIVDGEATKTITRTRNGETIERSKTLSDKKADRLSKRYARKVNSVFTDPFPEVPNPNEGKFTIEYEQGGEVAAPDFGSYGLNIEDTLLFPRYINYMNGNDESIEARRVYDKLNRKVHRYAKQGGMTAPDYMMTEVLRLGGSV